MKNVLFPILNPVAWRSYFQGAIMGACLAGWSVQAAPHASLAVEDLRCEYLTNPLGLDVREPRLSWKSAATDPGTRGLKQTGYQVVAASTMELLLKDIGDLWDTGGVLSDQSLNLDYGGHPLAAGQECHWKVRVRDQNGAWSRWSMPARWTMGLLAPSDWTALWIGTDQLFERKPGSPPPDNQVPDPWFRKVLVLDEAPRRATVYLASVGYHELFINGQKVGDAILAPSATDHSHRARYNTYEIASQLHPGTNVIGVWLGVSWSIFPSYQTNDKPRTPIVMAQADLLFKNRAPQRVVTDGTWKTHPSPNRLLGVWDFMHFGGELYDANRELPGWAEAGLDDSQWKNATTYHPQLALSADRVESNRLGRRIQPVAIEETTNGWYRVDMGINFAGWTEIEVAGQPGDRVDFEFSENPKETMTHRLHSAYIIGPLGRGVFRNRFNYSVGRWILVKGLKYKPAISHFTGWLVRTDYRRTGHFECSHPLLNQIYETTLWTFENLSLGGYVVDCPQRERMGYGGDAHATTETGLKNYDLGAFYTKWSQDWRDVQRPDGNLPYTAPTYWGGGGPGWSGYCVTLPWEMFQHFGDVRILAENYPTIQRWLAFLETKSAGDMLVRWGGEWDFLGDWLWPGAEGVNGDTPETLFYNNCYWIYNLQTAARIARVLGHGEHAQKWQERAAQVRHAVHVRFFNARENSYVNGFQAYLAVALLVGLPPREVEPAVWKRLEDEILIRRQGHIHAGITGGAFLFKTLRAHDRHDLLCEMVAQEDFPGWGDMLKRGATTMWESWEGTLSLLHSSYLYPGAWFMDGLGGIQPGPDGQGFKDFLLKPAMLKRLPIEWVKTSYDSPYGTIVTQWKFQGAQIHLGTVVPPNTTAILILPARSAAAIRESGRPLQEVASLSVLKEAAGQVALKLGSGHYQFQADYWEGNGRH